MSKEIVDRLMEEIGRLEELCHQKDITNGMLTDANIAWMDKTDELAAVIEELRDQNDTILASKIVSAVKESKQTVTSLGPYAKQLSTGNTWKNTPWDWEIMWSARDDGIVIPKPREEVDENVVKYPSKLEGSE